MNRLLSIALASTLATAIAGGLAVSAAHAQHWPTRPVRLIVPAPAGSSLDVVARTLGSRLQDRWGQAVAVENKAGAGGLLGMDAVAKAVPDGHTLGVGFNGPVAFGPHMYKKMPYDTAKDLLPVVLTTSQPNVLAVQASNPATTLPEFVAWAQKQAGRISYGSVGNGSSSHLTMEWFKTLAGLDAVHVPYAGSPPAATSLAAGDTQALFSVAPALLPLVQGGRVKLLAVTSLHRVDTMPELPTFAESGYPGFEALAWNGLIAPGATPAATVDRINADVNAVLKDAAVREALAQQGLIVGGGSAAAFKSFIEKESERWGMIIRKNGISVD